MSPDERAGLILVAICMVALSLLVAFGHVDSSSTVTVVHVTPRAVIAPTTGSTTTVAGTVTCVDHFGNPVRTDRQTALRSHLRCPNYSAGISQGARP